ncbi:MAG: helix-turn-helix transcriptional regulator [Candidatus Omnitrophota bacterium]|nr:helix-turn-helix transcriptional regulator [Candidatus Omnitrophota bacterium]
MRPGWLWDTNISVEEIQAILQDPQQERFVNMAALLLSRKNTPKEVFDQYLDRKVFVQHWNRIKRQMRKDSWNDPRIVFWQAVYEKLVAEFKAKGIAIRPIKQRKTADALSGYIAEMIKTSRKSSDFTQGELAKKIGISQQIISRIEKGQNDMRLLTLEKIAEHLSAHLTIELRHYFSPNRFSDGKKEVAHA